MTHHPPFVLLDDAREKGAADARFYAEPVEIVVARRPDEVEPALRRIEALNRQGYAIAGHLAYEAGLSLEPRLAPLAQQRFGAHGPLAWFGAFRGFETIPAAAVPDWLSARTGRAPASIGPLEPAISPGRYARAFSRLQNAIRAGDIYQANLTFPLTGRWRGDPLSLYAALRPAARAGYGGIVCDGADWLLSFSPELFFALQAESVTVRPMKGTRPRGRSPASDAALRDELAQAPKDRAENLMIVDLLRNDLSRVARPGSVRVERPFAVETYPTVHQMTTTVRAQIPEGRGVMNLLRALFPCGSITGAPKIRAMELIAEVESDARGPYCGAIGRIDPGNAKRTGDAAFNVAIRTLRLTRETIDGGRAVLGVGSAIVSDSEALSEWRECLVKGEFVRQATGEAPAAAFDLIETMAYAPDTGIALLELHLERIKASADALGFVFDRHAVRNAIQALCFDADEAPATLRLMASRSGAYSLELSPPPAPLPTPALCAVLRMPVDAGDWRLRHKTSDRTFYDAGLAAARAADAHEAIFVRDDGRITEGCFTSVFVERDGALLTPPLELGLLPGVLRRSLLDSGKAREAELTLDDLTGTFLIGNARRGLMKARVLP